MIYNLFLVLAVFVAGFIFWKRGREEHFTEDQLFDGFLLSVLSGIIAARCLYVVLHFGEFGWSLVAWLNIFSHGGLSLSFGVVAAMLWLVRFSRAQHWEIFDILDMWMPGLVAATAVVQFGVFIQTRLSPIPLVVGVLLIMISRYLYWLEYRYRTFAWYKSGQDVAKTGFITALGLIFLGIIFGSIALLPSNNVSSLVRWSDLVLFWLSFILGIALLINRSGRLTFNKKK